MAVRPTIEVSYSSSPVPLNLDSLRVSVNGSDWTSKFNRGASSAAYTVGGADTRVAGTLTIEASIADQSGASISVTADYAVLPTLQTLDPATGPIGFAVQVSGLGLDPSPSNNRLVFRAMAGGEVVAPFSNVLSGMNRGTALVPANADSGPVFLEVNGERSGGSLPFQVASPFPNCGNALNMFFMSDGSLLVLYRAYFAFQGAQHPAHPACPVVPDNGVNAARHTVVREHLDGRIDLVMDRPEYTFIGAERLVGLAVDKRGQAFAILTFATSSSSDEFSFRLYYYDEAGPSPSTVTFAGRYIGGDGPGLSQDSIAMAFDADGNVYTPVFDLKAPGLPLQVLKLSSSALSVGGQTTPTVAATDLHPPSSQCGGAPQRVCGHAFDLSITCEGHAFLGLHFADTFQGTEYGVVRELDLQSGSILGELTFPDDFPRTASTCRPDELLTTTGSDGLQISRSVGLGNPEAIAALPGLRSWITNHTSTLAVTKEGGVYLAPIHQPGEPRGFMVLVPSLVQPCTLSTSFLTAQPFPCSAPVAPIEVLSSTTRWKPQRGDEAIRVDFSGPDDLNVDSGTLEMAGPGGTITATGPIVRTSSTGPFTYRMEWNGRTYTDPNDGQVKRLPTGNYNVVVRGASQAGGSVSSAPYDKISLVEVSQIDILQCGASSGVDCPQGGARLGPNNAPGGGTAAFPDAVVPGGNFQRGVVVQATLQPDLGQDADQVAVHFRWIDVDDPSAGRDAQGQPMNHPVDDDTLVTPDNRDENASISTPVQAATDQGGATSFFSVSTRQGNNYRLAASTDEAWLSTLCGVISAGDGAVQHAPCNPGVSVVPLPLDESRQVSEMLTVWRMLHLELDRMDAAGAGVTQEKLQYNGSWTRIGRTWRSFPPFAAGRVLEDENATFVVKPALPSQEIDHSNENDWEGAVVDPFAYGGRDCADVEVPPCYRAVRNSNTKLTVASGDLNDEVNPDDRRYYVRDDELHGLPDVPHDSSLLKQVLKGVYIEVEEDAPNPNPLVPFTQNLSHAELQLVKGDTSSSEAYWSVPLVLAYESELKRDYDPTDERRFPGDAEERGPVAGETSYGDQPVSMVFIESIRDFTQTGTGCKKPTISLEAFYQSNAAHETLHALTLDDEGTLDGGLMCASVKNYVNQPHRSEITDAQRAQLRILTRPFVDKDNSGTCPSLQCQ